MTRSFFSALLSIIVLCCLPSSAWSADWLEPGVYPVADSQESGEIHAFGNAKNFGDLSQEGLLDLAAVAPSKTGAGYLVSTTAGEVHAFGDAIHRGDLRSMSLDAPIVDLSVTPDGNGYWLVTANGTVYAFGTALWRGSLTHLDLQGPVVDLEPHSSGDGYWLTSADGGVFAFGKAQFLGGLAERSLYRPVIDLLSTPDGTGYLLVTADGGIYTKGTASFRGSLANNGVSSSLIVAAEQTADGKGYWLVSQRGTVFTFGTAPHLGQIVAHELAPIESFAVNESDDGYWMMTSTPPGVPQDSGSGRRVIFSNQRHRVWLVEGDGSISGNFFVSGRADKPVPGSYQVFSKSRHTIAGHDDIRMEYMVRFTWGVEQAIGFHNIPIDGFGEAMQSEAQLGTYRSEGCVRLRDDQAAKLFAWAGVGTQVLVID
ncbi:MAG TPA: hypothetical protein DCL16_10795 [Acidimicrobiaceae bacterium]|nr:hypothetical protein [Acidimicrobiaceae bacterium]